MKQVTGRLMAGGVLAALTLTMVLHAQEFKIGKYDVQAHGFGTQGYIKTNDNNWLTMQTSGDGSGVFTDAGLNLGSQITSKLRFGGQVYSRKLGALGDWHPQLDWGMADYKAKPWLGFRGGKVKTVLGLYNDVQDLDFANTYALLPQSIYPIDLRDAMIAHEGGDIYGRTKLAGGLGTIAYTAYGGRRSDSMSSGYPYELKSAVGIHLTSYGGPVFGGDLRWLTPVKNLKLGMSRQNERISAAGTFAGAPYAERSRHDWTNQFYGQYTANRWHAESEYKRYYRDQIASYGTPGAFDIDQDIRGWYVGGGFTVNKWLEGGSYFSHYRDIYGGNLPIVYADAATKDLDKVVTAKFTLNRFTTVKVEGHFMDGAPNEFYPAGFYAAENPKGFANDTNAVVVRTGLSF
jgi:hypothetical protein